MRQLVPQQREALISTHILDPNDVSVPASEFQRDICISRRHEDRPIVALWEKTRKRGLIAMTTGLLMLPLCVKHALIIGIINDHKPTSTSLATEPTTHQLRHDNRSFVPPRQLQPVGDLFVRCLKPRRITRVYPKHPCLR